jgi:hypothetical protein
MSPLLVLLLKAIRAGTLGAAALLAAFIGIEVWKRWSPGAFASMTQQDVNFLAIMLLMLLGALLLAKSIAREIRDNSGA